MTAERPPKKVAPVVNLPEFLSSDLGPALTNAMQGAGARDLQLSLGNDNLKAEWDLGREDYTFILYFDEETVEGRKTLVSSRQGKGEISEMFMPPERGFVKVDSATMVELLMLKFTTTLSWLTKPVVAVKGTP
ncbi:DUF2996 domain-containing protein [Candidatus Cyanaurora vandensis]|uniref:DUF2996 domain-containing protein n=1 Tax=Candidatus Cyanaurora vandensis TaxID=2714958 RepID=UPI002580F981|nr:DUF2996 domain-containing protein [Candidatus Cyanaurora vandensis]